MSEAVFALRKYSKYSTAHSGCWNATDHTLNCIYSLEKFNPQQQLHLSPHPKRHPVAPGDSTSLPVHGTDSPCSCPSTVTASYTSKPKEFYLLFIYYALVLLALSFCNKKGQLFCSHVLQISKQFMLH